jgi:AcrR family transcriptional regulator
MSLPDGQERRREQILTAARRALEQQEYDQIQMRDVAQGAGVALGTLYRYFTSKEHLYAAVLRAWALPGLPVTPDRSASEQRVRARIHGVIAAYQRRPQFYKAQVTLLSSADPHARELLTEVDRAARAALAAEFAVLGPGPAEDAATMLWALVASRLTHAICRGGSIDDVHRLADQFVDLLAPRLHEAESDRQPNH